MRNQRNSFLQSKKTDRKIARRSYIDSGPGYFSRRQGWVAVVMTPVLAIGVAMGGLALPANAADVDNPATTSTSQPGDTASTPTDSGANAKSSSDGAGDSDASAKGSNDSKNSDDSKGSDDSSGSADASGAASTPPAPKPSPKQTPSTTEPAGPAAPSSSSSNSDSTLPAPSQKSATPQSRSSQGDMKVMDATGCTANSSTACLKIVKKVINTGGGTATASDWTFSAQRQKLSWSGYSDTGSPIAFNSGDNKKVDETGTDRYSDRFVITESTGPANYTQTSAICTKKQSVDRLKISNDQTITCTFTNTYVAPPKPASIKVLAGGIRSGSSSVGNLPDGAVFQAVASSGNPSGGPWVCPISNGTCTITGLPSGNSWNVSEKTAPSGWYLTSLRGTGGSGSSQHPYIFKTERLSDGDSYTVTTDGSYDSDSAGYVDENSRSFGKRLATSLNNPGASQKCGLDIALILDQSGSMKGTKQTNLQSAANDLIDGLTGTPSDLAMYTFAAHADTAGHIGSTSTSTASSAQPLHKFVNDLATPDGSTNWDQGLYQAADGNYDLVIFLTDGAPTVFGPSASGYRDSTTFRYVDEGIYSANAIKSAKMRLVGVGVGLESGAGANLSAVTGPTQDSDYYLASSSSFVDKLVELATGTCANQLTIQKQIQNPSGHLISPAPSAANGWDFTNTISSGSTIDGSVTTGVANDKNGFASAHVSVPAGATPTVTVTETQKNGYTLVGAQCSVNGHNVTTNVSGNKATFKGAANAPMACTFTNKQPQPPQTLTVNKKWVDSITGDVANITVSGGTNGSSTSPGGTNTDANVAHGEYANNAKVTIGETFGGNIKGSYTKALTCDGGSLTGGVLTMPNKDVTCTYTNTNATHKVTLQKTWVNSILNDITKLSINNGPTATSTANGDSGSWTDANHTTSATVPVGSTVTLTEDLPSGNSGDYDQALTCAGTNVVSGTKTIVMPNKDLTCTYTNTALSKKVTLIKDWAAGSHAGDTADLAINSLAPVTSTAPDSTSTSASALIGSSVTVSELLAAGNIADYTHTLVCTGLASGTDYSDGSFTMPSSNVTCTYTNTPKTNRVTLVKDWQNALPGDKVKVSVDGTNGPLSTATASNGVDTASEASSSPKQGSTVQLGEAWSTQHGTYLAATYVCKAGKTAVTVNADGTFQMPKSNVDCVVTNTGKTATVTLNKQWADALTGDSVSMFINTKSGTSTAASADQLDTNVVSVTLPAGSSIDLSEQPAQVNVGTYTKTLTCSADDTNVALGESGHTFTLGTKDVTCTYTNTLKTQTLTVTKTWVDGQKGDSTTFKLSDLPIGSSTMTGTSSPWTDTHTFTKNVPVNAAVDLAEVMSSGNVAQYNASVVCTNDKTGESSVSFTMPNSAVTCDYTNTAQTATLKLKKVVQGAPDVPNTKWILTGAGIGSPTVTNGSGGDTTAVTVLAGIDYSLSEAPVAGFTGASEFSAQDWVCYDGETKLPVTQGASGSAWIPGLVDDADVVCTIMNKHIDQGVTINKSVTENAQLINGSWITKYDIDVANKSKATAASYDLSDTLMFGGHIMINSAKWTGPGGISGSWAHPETTPAHTLVNGGTLVANDSATYTVTVISTVNQVAWDEGTTTCPGEGQSGSGGFLNSTKITSNGKSVSSQDCAEPATLTFNKAMHGSPTWDATTGYWNVEYDLTVTNSSDQVQVYNLNDVPSFAANATVISSSATKNGNALGGWDLTKPLAAHAEINGTSDHTTPVVITYRVSVVVDVAGISTNAATCDGAGTGFYNSATLTTGTIPIEDYACANIPTTTFTHSKSVVADSIVQAADGTWSIAYTITVKNDGDANGAYSLNDTLRFGSSIVAGQASWTPPDGASHSWADPTATATLATNAPLKSGKSATYMVSVSEIVVPKGVVGSEDAGTCPAPGSTDRGAFNNESGLSVFGHSTTETACGEPTNPDIAKSFVSAIQNGADPDQWTVNYTLTVDNSSGTNSNVYTLVDVPNFASGIAIDSHKVTLDGSNVPWSNLSDPIVSGATIGAGDEAVYDVAFTVTVNDVSSDNQKCSENSGGHGFFNTAALNVGLDSSTDAACGDVTPKVDPQITKKVASTTQNADGTWNIVYNITVDQPAKGETNPKEISAKYNVADTLKFGGGIDINSSSWTFNGGSSHDWAVAFDQSQTLATGQVIAAGKTDTYKVTVNTDVTQGAVDENTTRCLTGEVIEAGGFLNTALMTIGSQSTSADDCSEPAVPTVNKYLMSSTHNEDGTWTLVYNLDVTNPSSDTAAQFALKDSAAALPTGVTANGDWSAAAADGGTPDPTTSSWPEGTDATVAHGTITADTTYSYLVTVNVSTAPKAPVSECGEETGIVITNTGVVTSGQTTSTQDACGVVQHYDVGIVKTHDELAEGAVDSGKDDPINYNLVVTNNGTLGAIDVIVNDPVPSGLTIDTSSLKPASDWDFTGTTDDTVVASYIGNQGMLAKGASSTITFTATVGTLDRSGVDVPFSDIDNTACVAIYGPDDQPSNDCSTDTTKVKSIAVTAHAVCSNDTPIINYTLTPFNVSTQPKIAMIWWTPSAYQDRDPSIPASDKTGIMNDGASKVVYLTLPAGWHNGDPISGSQLWPGAAVDVNGNVTAWPGWRQLPSGQWVIDPAAPFYNLRGEATVEIRINPSSAETHVYPPATPNCNAAPPKFTPTTPASSGGMADTGSDVFGPLGLSALFLMLGGFLFFWIRRRREDGQFE